MYPSLFLAVVWAAAEVTAKPFISRYYGDKTMPQDDVDVLNYALTLEYLERRLYEEGLAKYTIDDFRAAGFDDDLYSNLESMYADERSHVELLAGSLGSSAIPEPTFNFPHRDAKSFVALASIIEGVGVSAYLGAAARISHKAYATVAGSIMTVEAKHSAYARAKLGRRPSARPYDTPLNPNQVFSIASQFIGRFGNDSIVPPFRSFPELDVAVKMSYMPGKETILFTDAFQNAKDAQLVDDKTDVFVVIFSGLKKVYVPATIMGTSYTAHIPAQLTGSSAMSGPTYVVLSTADGRTEVSDENTIAGVGVVEMGGA